MKKLIICSVIALWGLNAYAVGVTQEGTPTDTSLTKAYGINVAAKTGLKAIIPSDFKLYVHKDVSLPEYISWNIGKSWIDELSKIAALNGLNILIKWDQKAVFVTTEKVIEDNKESATIAAQAAKTPLPKFKQPKDEPAPVEAPAPKLSEESTTVVTKIQPAPVKKDPPLQVLSATEEARQQEMASIPASAPAWNDFKYTAPMAFSKLSVRQTAQVLANSFNLRLNFYTPDFKMPGPVTLFGKSVEEDVGLLNAALGYYHYAFVGIDEQGVFVAIKPGRRIADKDLIPATGLSLPYDPEPVVSTVSAQKSLSKDETLIPTSGVVLNIPKGVTLESVLYAAAKQRGYMLEWKVAGGFEATKPLKYSSDTFENLLKEVLPKVGLTSDIKNKTITVSPGAAQP